MARITVILDCVISGDCGRHQELARQWITEEMPGSGGIDGCAISVEKITFLERTLNNEENLPPKGDKKT